MSHQCRSKRSTRTCDSFSSSPPSKTQMPSIHQFKRSIFQPQNEQTLFLCELSEEKRIGSSPLFIIITSVLILIDNAIVQASNNSNNDGHWSKLTGVVGGPHAKLTALPISPVSFSLSISRWIPLLCISPRSQSTIARATEAVSGVFQSAPIQSPCPNEFQRLPGSLLRQG